MRADFHLTPRNLQAIVSLVQVLHGMPLAIELAATRVRSFAPAELLALLSGRRDSRDMPSASALLRSADPSAGPAEDPPGRKLPAPRPRLHNATHQLALLARTGPRSGGDPRHASMSDVIAWSWRLLDLQAQALMMALTVFPIDAPAPAIAAAADLPLAQTATLLDSLVSQSMVRTIPTGNEEARFVLLEPVREFAAQQATPPVLHRAAAALRRWYIGWAQSLSLAAVPSRVAPELATLYSLLRCPAVEVDDLLEPLAMAQEVLALALALRAYWETDAMPDAVQSALEHALAQIPQAQTPLRCDTHELLAYLRFEAGFVAQAQVHAQAAVAAAPPGSDAGRRARALARRAWVFLAAGHGEADSRQGYAEVGDSLREALALATACGDREVQARALYQQAVLVRQTSSDLVQAEALTAQSEALWLALGDRRKAFARLRNRAQCWVRMGRVAEAKACFERCEQVALEDGDWVGQFDSQQSLASLLGGQRHWAAALAVNRRCVALCWQRWHRHGLGYALWIPARLLARLRQPEAAMRLLGFAATYWATQFGPLSGTDESYVRRVKALVVAQVGVARAQALWQEGLTLNLADAVALALQAG